MHQWKNIAKPRIHAISLGCRLPALGTQGCAGSYFQHLESENVFRFLIPGKESPEDDIFQERMNLKERQLTPILLHFIPEQSHSVPGHIPELYYDMHILIVSV